MGSFTWDHLIALLQAVISSARFLLEFRKHKKKYPLPWPVKRLLCNLLSGPTVVGFVLSVFIIPISSGIVKVKKPPPSNRFLRSKMPAVRFGRQGLEEKGHGNRNISNRKSCGNQPQLSLLFVIMMDKPGEADYATFPWSCMVSLPPISMVESKEDFSMGMLTR